MTGCRGEPKEQTTRSLFAALALGSVLAGLAVYLLQAPLGIPPDTAQFIALAFIGVGIADVAVLYFWDRIFKRDRSPSRRQRPG
jgi:hypothetical protein